MPEWDQAAVERATGRMRLAMDPRRRRQGIGSRLGAGPGASLEFHDYRNYVAGDDLRHLDWGVYARSDQLVLRRHRQEVSPRVEIVLDLSQSMAVSPDKLTMTANIAALLASLAEADGLRPHIWELSAQARRLGGSGRSWRHELTAARPGGTAGLEYRPLPQLALGSERILISDGLCPSGASNVVRGLGTGAGRICLVQILRREECAPTPLGAVRLIDVEGFGGGAADLIHDEATCEEYRQRFMRHQGEWQSALSGRGAGVVTCLVEEGFDAALRRMLDRGLVEVKAA